MAWSPLKCHPPRIGDLDTDHLYNRAARTRNDLSLRRCEAFIDEASDHVAIESMGKPMVIACRQPRLGEPD